MTEPTVADVVELAPEPPPKGPRVWLRENLFSTPASSVMSVVAIAVALASIRGLMGFLFDPARRWEAVTYNMRLLMVQAYPVDQFLRVWFSVAFVAVLLAATLAVYRIGGRMSPRRLGTTITGIGAFVALAGLLSPFSFAGRVAWVVVGAALAVVGYLARTLPGERAKEPTIPTLGIVTAVIALVLAALWVVRLPFPVSVDGEQTVRYLPIAASTRIPWLVVALVGVATYFAVKAIRDRVPEAWLRRTVVTLWAASYPFLVLVVLRDPELDYGTVLSRDLPIFLGFALVGAAVLQVAATRAYGELGRVIGAVAVVAAIGSFFVPVPYVVRFLLIGFALFALAAPAFGGEGRSRLAFLGLWILTAALVSYFYVVATAPSSVEVPGSYMLGGLGLTLVLSVTAIVASFPLGLLLALGRTSSMPIFRLMSTTYIELVRGVPLITWLLVAFIMLPVALPPGVEIGGVMRAIGAMTFFSAAYLAENVRGGLQAIPKGQYEAARALGMSTAQMTLFIVLPQALRAVIPALVGQVIAIFKDTSLVTIVGLFDFLHIARAVIPGQSQPFNFLGTFREPLLFAAVVYWMFTFTFSRISLRLEKKLGVGER
ncbi:MAG TPA: amino acid ABC transporter permease [Actinobacteria bacterium]|nr:amino acid ABC transporter permease [Actinomycetota bacterium]